MFGWSGDDSIAYLQYNIGGGSWTQDTTLNGQGTYGGFADHSWSHRSNNGPMGASLMVQFWPNTTSQVGVRMRATSENNNNGGFWLNGGQMPTTAGNDYNSGSATSTLTLLKLQDNQMEEELFFKRKALLELGVTGWTSYDDGSIIWNESVPIEIRPTEEQISSKALELKDLWYRNQYQLQREKNILRKRT